MQRVVCDANIYVSSLVNPKGIPGSVIDCLFKNNNFEIVVSLAIIEELQRVLFYPKVRKYINLTDIQLNHWVEALIVRSHIVEPRFNYDTLVLEDPDDDRYLIAAIESKASYLITGDRHLLDLSSNLIKILTAREFFDMKNSDKALPKIKKK